MQRELDAPKKGCETFWARHFPLIQEVFEHGLLLTLLRDKEVEAVKLSESAAKSTENWKELFRKKLLILPMWMSASKRSHSSCALVDCFLPRWVHYS